MKKIMALLGATFTYFCIATVIALSAGLAAIWFKGALDQGRAYRLLAALHGIDVITMQQNIAAQESELEVEQPSYLDRLEAVSLANLDLDLRENAIQNAWQEMNSLRIELEVRASRFEELKNTYAAKLKQEADEQQANSLNQLQTVLEAMKPDQAKLQIIKIYEAEGGREAVVTLFKNMAMDKRKKLIAEFKAGNDAQILYDILNDIRLGEPGASQTRETQEQLNNVGGQ